MYANRSTNRRSLPLAALATLALALLAGCEADPKTYPQTALAPRSDFAIAIDSVQSLTLWLAVGVGVVVFAILAYILVRFRYRPGDPMPEQVHGNTRLELAWTLIPALLIAVIAVPTVETIFETQQDAPPDAIEVTAIGWQWWFEFRYPLPNGDTVYTANEIHVPVGQPVAVRIRGGDVIHSFWIPQMGGKRDMIPNRENLIVFTPLEPGVYLGQCAEFCGESHALMRMRLVAHEPAEYERWLQSEYQPAAEPADSALMIGRELVVNGACAACHQIRGTTAAGRQGPDLTHFGRRRTVGAGIMENNAENLAAWIRNPPAVKPGTLMPALGLSEEQIEYIVAYLQSLY